MVTDVAVGHDHSATIVQPGVDGDEIGHVGRHGALEHGAVSTKNHLVVDSHNFRLNDHWTGATGRGWGDAIELIGRPTNNKRKKQSRCCSSWASIKSIEKLPLSLSLAIWRASIEFTV